MEDPAYVKNSNSPTQFLTEIDKVKKTKHCVGDHTWLITLSFPFPKGAPVDLDGVFTGLRPLSLLSLGVLSTWTNFKLWADFFCPSFVSPDCLEH